MSKKAQVAETKRQAESIIQKIWSLREALSNLSPSKGGVIGTITVDLYVWRNMVYILSNAGKLEPGGYIAQVRNDVRELTIFGIKFVPKEGIEDEKY